MSFFLSLFVTENMTVTVVPAPETEFRETDPALPSILVVCDSLTAPLPPLPLAPACADFSADADVDAPESFEPEPPPRSQDAKVTVRPTALTTARTRRETVIMMEPPLLVLRPPRPEECKNSKRHSSSEKWVGSHGERTCSTRIYLGPHGLSKAPGDSPWSDG